MVARSKSMTGVSLAIGLAAVMAFATGSAIALPLYRIVELGGLGDDNSTVISGANAINDFGMVVGFGHAAPGEFHAALFDTTGGGANIDLGTLGGEDSTANDISTKGVIVGSADLASGRSHATRFDPSGGGANVDLGGLPGGLESSAMAVSESGGVVGQADVATQGVPIEHHATRFDISGSGANIDFAPVSGKRSIAHDVDDAGGIVGERVVAPGDFEATKFDPTGGGANTFLGGLSGSYSKAFAVNAAGMAAGEGFETLTRAVLFDPLGPEVNLGLLPGKNISTARGINDAGVIVGTSSVSGVDARAVLFDPTGGGANIDLNDLIDPSDPLFGIFELLFATDINNLGQIVGTGIRLDDSSPRRRAFLLNPVVATPEPATVLLLGAGLIVVAGRVRCARRSNR